MENEGFDLAVGATDFKAEIGSLFGRNGAGHEVAGNKFGKIFARRLAGDFEDGIAPAKAGFSPGADFQNGENLGGRGADEAKSFGKVRNLHRGWGNPGGGFKHEAKVFWGGKFEGAAKVDGVGPDGEVGPIHDLAFRFGHESFGGDFGGHAGEGVFINTAAGFLFALSQGDGAKDGAEDGARGQNFIGGEEEVLGENDAVVFNLKRKGEAEGGLHLWIPLCGKALSQEGKAEK